MSGASILCFAILAAWLVLAYKRPGIAFTTTPVGVGLVWYVATATDTAENLLIMVPAVFLGTLAVVAATGLDRRDRQWFHWGAWYLLIGIATVLLAGLAMAGFGILGGGYIVAVVLICSVITVFVSLTHCVLTRGRRTSVDVFSTIAAVMRQNLPLPMALDCAAIGADYGTAAVFREVKRWLVQGCSLADALRRGYPRCPPGHLAMVAAGERIGQLPATLAAIETDVKSQTLGPRKLRPIHPFYPVFVVVLILLLVLGLLTFVVPRFEQVLKDMMAGSELPLATRVLIRSMRWLAYGPYGIGLFFAVILIAKFRFWCDLLRGGGHPPSVLLWPRDLLLWHIPFVRRFERDRAMVQVLSMLRISLAAGCPVNEAVRGTLQLEMNGWFRKRLRDWLTRIVRGENLAQSARRSGLGRSLAWAFDGGVNEGNAPAILEMLESHYRSLYAYRVNVARYILWPVGILLLGLMVGFVAYAIFSPAVMLINVMALNVYP